MNVLIVKFFVFFIAAHSYVEPTNILFTTLLISPSPIPQICCIGLYKLQYLASKIAFLSSPAKLIHSFQLVRQIHE
jgi:hypothetical protein